MCIYIYTIQQTSSRTTLATCRDTPGPWMTPLSIGNMAGKIKQKAENPTKTWQGKPVQDVKFVNRAWYLWSSVYVGPTEAVLAPLESRYLNQAQHGLVNGASSSGFQHVQKYHRNRDSAWQRYAPRHGFQGASE